MLPVSCCRFLYVFGGRDVFSVFVEVDVIVRWAVGDNDKSRSETPSGVGRLQVQCANVMKLMLSFGGPWATTINLIQKRQVVERLQVQCANFMVGFRFILVVAIVKSVFGILLSCSEVGSSYRSCGLVFLEFLYSSFE
ncbi:hypothetical protein DY000_02062448 [Brassica cretica]|uniref:Uncharacterized protein n=1 Tax=Brassica cretica TaxID=69181 RepID=A0ABQ7AND4_BRACR|nr:hypothetical protein DY000_02062448 [Brassica cretica]